MKGRRLLLLSLVPLSLLLAYLSMDLVRTYLLEPLVYALRIERLLVRLLPQAVWWGAFLLLLAFFAVRSLRYKRNPVSRRAYARPQSLGQARTWSRMVRLSRRGNYSKWLLARNVSELAVAMIAHQERLTPAQTRVALRAGKVKLPPEVWAYLQVGLDAPSFPHYADFLSRLRSARHPSALDLDLEVILTYLEDKIDTGGPL